MNRDVIMCRCEDVTYGEIVDVIDEGLTTTEEIKRVLRCGMGPCQGRTCSRLIARIIAEKTGAKVADVPYPTVRPPSRPVEIGTLAEPDAVNVRTLTGTSDEE
jgi:bacterioferritin-associated ferredoxin